MLLLWPPLSLAQTAQAQKQAVALQESVEQEEEATAEPKNTRIYFGGVVNRHVNVAADGNLTRA